MVVVTETLDASVAAAEQTEQFLRTFDLESDPASPEPSADGDAASGSFSCHSKDGLAETEYDFDAQCLSAQQHHSFFAVSLLTNVQLCPAKLPWEQGVAKQIFDDDGLGFDVLPKLAHPSIPAGALMADFDGAAIAEEVQRHSDPRECIFEHCVKCVPNVDVKTERAIS